MYYLLFQAGQELLETSLTINKQTVASWDTIWEDIITPQNALWQGLCTFSMTLAAMGIIFITYQMAWDYQQQKLFLWNLPASFIWPLIIAILLAGSGSFLSKEIKFLRAFSYQQINSVLDYQVGNNTFKKALQAMTLTINAKQQVNLITAECVQKIGLERAECIKEKQPLLQGILSNAQSYNGGTLPSGLNYLTSGWSLNPLQNISNDISNIVIGLLWACQWAFVNILEATLLFTSLMAPVFTGLSMIPLGKRAIWAWASNFFAIFTAQLGYTVVIGLAAIIMDKIANQTSATDLAFLVFICIFSPVLATLVGAGGGLALFSGISSSASAVASAGANVTGMGLGKTIGIVKKLLKN